MEAAPTGRIEGIIRDFRGRPSVEVTLELRGWGPARFVETDSKGWFVLPKSRLKANLWLFRPFSGWCLHHDQGPSPRGWRSQAFRDSPTFGGGSEGASLPIPI